MMHTKGFYPLDGTEGQIYAHTFRDDYWDLESQLERFKRSVRVGPSQGTLGEVQSVYTDPDKLTRVKLEAGFLSGATFNADAFPVSSLVKTTYEAAAIRGSKKDLSVEDGEFTASQFPFGFSVNYRHPNLHGTYTRRVALHIISPARRREGKVAVRLAISRDFKNGDTLAGDVINRSGILGPAFLVASNPELFMEASARDGWDLGRTYVRRRASGNSLRRPCYTGYLRPLKTEVFLPDKTTKRPPKTLEPKRVRSSTFRPALNLH